MKTMFTFSFLLLSSLLMAQSNFKTAVNTLQLNDYTEIYDLVQLADGSYVGVGETDYNTNDVNIIVVKLNAQGSLLSSTVITSGTDSYDAGIAIIKTNDGGFAVSGEMGDSMALLKFNASLGLQWQKKYAESGEGSSGARLVQTPDGGFLVTGYAYDENDNTAGYLVKTNSQGNLTFSKQYGDFDDNILIDIVATSDGNYAMLLSTGDLEDAVSDNSYLIKIKSDGSVIWTSQLNTGGNGQFPVSLIQASDGGFVISGIVEKNIVIEQVPVPTFEMMMAKFNSAGTLLWAKNTAATASNLNYTIGFSVAEDKDGGYLFGGSVLRSDADFSTDTSSAYLVKLSKAGDLVYTKTIDENIDEASGIFYSIIGTGDGGFAAAGSGFGVTNSLNNSSGIVYKFDGNGTICGQTGSYGSLASLGTSAFANIVSADLTSGESSATVTTSTAGTATNICSILPLQLLSFTAALQNKSVSIGWKTTNEVNTDHFTVERSSNGTAFTSLQTVSAKGSGTAVQTYTTNDLQPLAGTSYYRLKQVDKDGSFVYSGIVPLTISASGSVAINPNPVRNEIHVLMQSAVTGNATFIVTDMTGKTLLTQTTRVVAGANTVLIPAASLSKGLYVLKINSSGLTQSVKFIKE